MSFICNVISSWRNNEKWTKWDASYPVKVYQNTSYGVEEAWQLVDIVIIPVRLCQVHLLAALNQLCVHQIYILGAHHLTRLTNNTIPIIVKFTLHQKQLQKCKIKNKWAEISNVLDCIRHSMKYSMEKTWVLLGAFTRHMNFYDLK